MTLEQLGLSSLPTPAAGPARGCQEPRLKGPRTGQLLQEASMSAPRGVHGVSPGALWQVGRRAVRVPVLVSCAPGEPSRIPGRTPEGHGQVLSPSETLALGKEQK